MSGDMSVDDSSEAGGSREPESEKIRRKRSGNACTACRKVKAKCTGAPHCERCRANSTECIFVKSRRGAHRQRMAVPKEKATHSMAFMPDSIDSEKLLVGPSITNNRDWSRNAAPITSPFPSSNILRQNTAVDPWEWVEEKPTPAHVQFSPHTSEATNGTEKTAHPEDIINPLGLLASVSLDNAPARRTEVASDSPGTGSSSRPSPLNGHSSGPYLDRLKQNYFMPKFKQVWNSSAVDNKNTVPSELITTGLLNEQEVDNLFNLYFTHLHRHFPILAQSLHTARVTNARSPFLALCICTVASRYYSKRTDDLYAKCLLITKRAGFNALALGQKAVELCQGFLLLCRWSQPAETFEDELAYQMSGIAARLAMDLNLHRRSRISIPPDVSNARAAEIREEMRNRERTWLMVFVSDHSVATQSGKPHCTLGDDEIVRGVISWNEAPDRQAEDGNLAAMVQLHLIVGSMVKALREDWEGAKLGDTAALATRILLNAYASQLDGWFDKWIRPDPFRNDVEMRAPAFYYHYYQLLLSSFGVQRARTLGDNTLELSQHCLLCYTSANKVIDIAKSWHASGLLRFSIDPIFITLSYASTYLLKLGSGPLAALIPEATIYPTISQVVDLLEECAADDLHTPALYARFLSNILANRQSMSTSGGEDNGTGVETVNHSGTLLSGAATPVWAFDQSDGNQWTEPTLDFSYNFMQDDDVANALLWGNLGSLASGSFDL